MAKRSNQFGRLLKAGLNSIAMIEGKTGPIVDDEVGALVGLAATSLQRYRSGAIPEDRFTAIFAEACVSRGLMGRSWLERFLRAASFPPFEGQALIARLFPEAPTGAALPTRMRPNLPISLYAQFVMRRAAYDATLDGLRSAIPLTVIVSMGGMGKSSLACAVAAGCTRSGESGRRGERETGRRGAGDGESGRRGKWETGSGRAGAGESESEGALPRFAVAVWVSDKDRPGSLNLSTTLDEVARVLDYPGLMSLAFSEKRRAIENLLRTQPVLLVLDNAETISDAGLLEWVSVIPAPSKAIVTTRSLPPAHLAYHLVELGSMTHAEARTLIAERLRHGGWQARLDQLPALLPIAEAAGGNPKAIIMALGLVQRQSRPVDEVIAALQGADMQTLFDDLFLRSWDLLEGAAQQGLLSVALFPASAAEAALGYVADLSPSTLRRVAAQLVELSLLDTERDDLRLPPRYTMHPLVRAFAASQLETQSDIAERLHERWLRWCLDLAGEVGFSWDRLERLDLLTNEHETIQAALEWAAGQSRDRETLALAEGVRYMYNVHGLWDTRRNENYRYRIEASTRLGDTSQLVLALAQLTEVLSKQGTLAQAADWLAQAEAAAEGASLSTDARFELGHACALLAHAHGDLAEAERLWRALLPLAAKLDAQKHVVNRRWLATALLDQGQTEEAITLYHASLTDARRANDTRSVTGNTLKLAAIDLSRGDLDAASRMLAECHAAATRYDDRRRLAECHRLTAQLAALRGDAETASAERQRAIDLFERMGMRREAEEMRRAGS